MDTVNGLSAAQVQELLAPISPDRIAGRKSGDKEFAYLPQWDVRRRLIEIFGFGGFDIETLELKQASVLKYEARVFVVYEAQVRLILKDASGQVIARYDDAATGDAIGYVGAPTHEDDIRLPVGKAFDVAVKSAISNALNRCTTNLGDQFGLSLYNNGSTDAVVGDSVPHRAVAVTPADEVAQEPFPADCTPDPEEEGHPHEAP